MERPKLPKRYIKKEHRQKNGTPLTDEYWKKCVNESIEYDKAFETFQGTARIDLMDKNEIMPLEPINYEKLITQLKNYFEIYFGKPFDNINDSFIRMLVDNTFTYQSIGMEEKSCIEHEYLRKLGGNEIQVRAEKNLWIIGNYGCGKSSMVKLIDSFIFDSNKIDVEDMEGRKVLLNRYRGNYHGFNKHTAIEIVRKQENKQSVEHIFNAKYLTIDDLFKESKYMGKETIGELIEYRYDNGLSTNIISNFYGEQQTIESTLNYMTGRYGGRMADLVFEMFNFYQLNNKSLRK